MKAAGRISGFFVLFCLRAWSQSAVTSSDAANAARMTTSILALRREHDPQILKAFDAAEKLSRKGSHRVAIHLFDGILDAYPGYSEARNNLALEFDALGDVDRAVEELRRILENDPAFRLAYTNLGAILCNHGRYREAESLVRQGVRVLGAWPKARLVLGVALIGQGQWTREARENLTAASRHNQTAKDILGAWAERGK